MRLSPRENNRQHKRIPVTLNAEVVSDGKRYEGIIGNVSEEGLGYTLTTFIKTPAVFIPKGSVEIFVRIPRGEAPLRLDCEVRWFLNPSTDKKSIIMGMQILEPPEEYKEWIKRFHP